MMADQDTKLGDILLKKGWIDAPGLQRALDIQKTKRQFLGTILVSERRITEEQLAQVLSEQSGIPFVTIQNFYIDWKLVMKFSASLILDYQCFPLKKEGSTIVFGITNILDGWARAQIEQETKGTPIQLALMTYSDMKQLLERFREYVNIKTRRLLD